MLNVLYQSGALYLYVMDALIAVFLFFHFYYERYKGYDFFYCNKKVRCCQCFQSI